MGATLLWAASHWAVEGAPETALWGAGTERPSHPRAGVARQHVCLQCLAELGSEIHLYPEAIHPEGKKDINNGVCLKVFYLAQNQRCELITPYSCLK